MAKRYNKIRTPKVTQPRNAYELIDEFEGESDVDDMHRPPSIPSYELDETIQMLNSVLTADAEVPPKPKTPVVAG